MTTSHHPSNFSDSLLFRKEIHKKWRSLMALLTNASITESVVHYPWQLPRQYSLTLDKYKRKMKNIADVFFVVVVLAMSQSLVYNFENMKVMGMCSMIC